MKAKVKILSSIIKIMAGEPSLQEMREYLSSGKVEVRTDTNKKRIAYCPFCPLGEPEKRGVYRVEEHSRKVTVRTIKGKKVETPHFGGDRFDLDEWTKTRYECALGKVGKNCSIPKLYDIASKAHETAEHVADQNPMIY